MPRVAKKIIKRVRKITKRQRLSYLWSKEQAKKDGLYFPKRRVRVGYPSKVKILKRIETQDFKGATEQYTFKFDKLFFEYPKTRD